jgi:hypothetical protein
MLEEHMHIDERGITERLGAATYHWYHDFRCVDGWEGFVANASWPREGEENAEDTVLLMNAGVRVRNLYRCDLLHSEIQKSGRDTTPSPTKQKQNKLVSKGPTNKWYVYPNS